MVIQTNKTFLVYYTLGSKSENVFNKNNRLNSLMFEGIREIYKSKAHSIPFKQ